MHDPKFRKLVVFTDSRQDVAKLSAGIELDHYRDVVRQSMVRSFTRLAGDVHAFLKSVDDPRKFKSLSHEEQVAYRRFTENNKDLCNKIRALQQFDDSPENLRADKELRVWADGPYRLSQIDSSIKAELLALGCNPAGPWPSLASDGGQHVTGMTFTTGMASRPTRKMILSYSTLRGNFATDLTRSASTNASSRCLPTQGNRSNHSALDG